MPVWFAPLEPSSMFDQIKSIRPSDKQIASAMEEPFRPPLPSAATRKLPLRSKSSNRGSLVNPATGVVTDYHSVPERNTLLVTLARRDVLNVHEQPPAVEFRDIDGKLHHHTFDFLVHLTSGRKVAVAVKPYDVAARKNLMATLQAIAAQLPAGFADEVKLITERNLHPDDVYNAELIQSVRTHPNPESDEQVRAVACTLVGAATIECITTQFERRGEAFRSVVHLIYRDELRLVGARRITHGARVVWVSNLETAA